MSTVERQLRVQTGICQRLLKEVKSYQKDVVQQSEKIEAFKSEGKDPYEIKQLVQVLKETETVLPDSMERLEASLEKLRSFVATTEIPEEKKEETDAIIKTVEEFLQEPHQKE